MKKIKVRSDNLTIYDDYSMDVKCRQCGKIDELQSDHPQAVRISQIEAAANNYVCLDCWKKNKDREKQEVNDARVNDIRTGQAINLAVLTALKTSDPSDPEAFFKEIIKWQELYKKFIEKQQNGQS